jgi:hypothetical protein
MFISPVFMSFLRLVSFSWIFGALAVSQVGAIAEGIAPMNYYVVIPRCEKEAAEPSFSCAMVRMPAKSGATLWYVGVAEGDFLWKLFVLDPSLAKYLDYRRFTNSRFSAGHYARLQELQDILLTIKKSTTRSVILEPLLDQPTSAVSLWANARELQALVELKEYSPDDCERFVLRDLLKLCPMLANVKAPQSLQEVLKALFRENGVPVDEIHYDKQFNFLVIRANADFPGLAEAAFATGKD